MSDTSKNPIAFSIVHMKGISLIEIMIAVAIVGIVMVLAMSSLRDYAVNEAIRTVTEDINIGLKQARMEAISRNTTVQFTLNGPSWSIRVIQAGNAPLVLDQRTIRENETNVQVTPNAMVVTFNGQGFTTPFAGFNSLISNPAAGTCMANGGNIRCLQIQISAGGRIRSCDPAVLAPDPRAC